ncbi:MAG: collagen binding domain-containing protein, partial [Thermoanaerobaculia bacterium]
MRFLARALYTIVFISAAAAAGAATVSGIVTSAATGNALNGMVVAAYDPAGNLVATATTDATGLYVLTVPAGQYRLLAYDLAGVYATAFDANAESFETSPLRSIPAAGAQVSFALVNGGRIAGMVLTVNGPPLADAVVEVYNLSGTRRGFTTTNANGDYSVVVPPGQYKIIAYDPTGTFAASFYSGARTFADATPMPVVEFALTNVSFVLTSAARVIGKTIDAATGAALASILVYAYTPAGAIV